MFGNRRKSAGPAGSENAVLLVAPPAQTGDETLTRALADAAGGEVVPLSVGQVTDKALRGVRAVVALFPDPDELDQLALRVKAARAGRNDGWPVLVVGLAPGQLTAFGAWLTRNAPTDGVDGLRLVVDADPLAIAAALGDRLAPVIGPNVVAMPVSTEVETADYKYFYCLSPQLRGLLAQLAELAANGIERVYLLGGPGSGKTSLAYYFYLARAQGNFVTVNLTSESTDDKAAMKSLLCGHVAGAFPGAGSRTGAFAHSREGVCFLDESHGVSGSVMEVLMEALDSGQYLPYGASAKQPLRCAVVFASNRTWETLISQVNLDEHARLGAVILHLADLSVRQEDLIAVLAATLAGMASKATSWQPPAGLSDDAWALIRDCPWRGNTRALMRVAETAFVSAASLRMPLIEREQVSRAMDLWEPAEHASHAIYTRAGDSGLGDAAPG
ncbi:sigma 54-interacting transcriptional regulator [Spectribacter hydrogenooxidans]|uniref:Sigma 54-interacting transcriptional regulator n=1 Tax=Spectribacter hydrogenoxidans TaxID=3075608 RepID=A0ABU3BZL1_9GAMM|nr:sigma 54-interacting transcriptional regulator [Salinisphaera sp. W335]MDT0634737.1 sigma 54-interacting transcriptional regulator [Salinisphaera sp. W335]